MPLESRELGAQPRLLGMTLDLVGATMAGSIVQEHDCGTVSYEPIRVREQGKHDLSQYYYSGAANAGWLSPGWLSFRDSASRPMLAGARTTGAALGPGAARRGAAQPVTAPVLSGEYGCGHLVLHR